MSAERIFLLYRITCRVTGKEYIGLTSQKLRARWNAHHRKNGRSADMAIARAIRKYGDDVFVIEQIASARGRVDACIVEQALVAQYRTRHPGGYNLTDGGEGGKGRRFTDAMRQRNSEIHRGKTISPEARAKMAAAKIGTTVPAATRAKMSASAKAYLAAHPGIRRVEFLTDEHRAKLVKANRNRPASVNKRIGDTLRERAAARKRAGDQLCFSL